MSIGEIDKSKILGLYSPSGVFELKRIYAERHEVRDPCCADKFADVTYTLVIWRRPKFFLFNYIQPAVLINILALFVFLIPAESGEKITLGISTMLNMTVFLMTVTSGIPPTDQTPILSVYYATVMVLTTAATVLGVIVLRIHHQGRRGIPVPAYLRRLAQWMALVTFYKYPPIEKQLENLNNGMYSAVPQSDSYCYNIKDELGGSGKKKGIPFQKAKNPSKSGIIKEKKLQPNGRPANSPRFRPKSKVNSVSECENSAKKGLVSPKVTHNKDSENEYSDIKTEDEDQTLQKPKPSMLWKKVSKNVEDESKKKEEKKDPWKDLGTVIMEERYKAEERKEISGEEWRKISRIFDRFLLVIFTMASLVATLWCIFTSPHFPDPDADDDRVATTKRS
eukprot:GFUD01034340.1.p1 GENE.GFUD01034340.1~~GFUD01034340.1.p1  ORF type:complete len:436 (+),score=85.73 GFUD01034340.1:128-1309(+)